MRPLWAVPWLLLAGCTSRTPPATPAPRVATQVGASMRHTWDAVIDVLAARNIPIRTVDRASGLVVTDALSIGQGEGRDWADCGQVNQFNILPDNATYNVLVRGDSSASTVKATVRWTHWSKETISHEECSTTHVWEREFEAEVKHRAEATLVAGGGLRDGQTGPELSSKPPQRLPRGNSELLRTPEFSLAVADCIRLGLIRSYGETSPDTLVVDLTDNAMTGSATEYNLGRLFNGYQRTAGGSPTSVLELRYDGAKVGEYTATGLHGSNWR